MTEKSKERPKRNMGPHGVGDPDDQTLRKMEYTLLVPQIRREIVRNEKCSQAIDGYQNCVLKHGLFKASLSCRPEKVAMHDCLEYWNDDEELFLRAKKQYLEERTEYRRTGISKSNLEVFEKHLEEKKKAEEENKQQS